MERRQTHSFFRSRLRRATTLSRGDRDPSRRSTVAVFGCGPTLASLGSGTPEPLRLPRQALKPGGRGPNLPAVRFAPQARDATPGSVFRIVSRKRPSEPGYKSTYYIFVT